jgi:3',5'-cyclic AMP phosphodiesterase CpdA
MPVRVLHMSDIHFGGEDIPAVEAAALYAGATPFDLLVVSGDLTQWGAPEEFRAAAAWLGDLPGPRLTTPGNHDTPWSGLLERVTAPFARYARSIGSPRDASHAAPGLAVEAVNSARGWQIRLNWSKGEVSRRQAGRVSRRLEAAPADAARIVVCHHPLLEVAGAPMTARVRGGRHAARRFAAAGVDLVLTGHLHVPFFEPLPYGDGQTYAVGAGTLSLRERGAPAGFNILDIDTDKITVRAMAWRGAAFTVEHTWVAPRRTHAAERGSQNGY